MKLAIAHIHSAVHGNVASVVMAPGDQVDLDQVVGHQEGQPVSLEAALGARLVEGFTLAASAADSEPRGRSARRATLAAPAVETEKE